MGSLLVAGILYVLVAPLLLGLLGVLKNQLKYLMYGGRRSNTRIKRDNTPPKEQLSSKISKRLNFTLKEDKRSIKGVSIKLVFFIIYLTGLAIALLSSMLGQNTIMVISLFIPYIAIMFSYKTASPIVEERESIIARMLSLKSERMGLIEGGKVVTNPSAEIKILDWGEDYLSPKRLHFYMPTRFDPFAVESFLTQFNTLFGFNGQWVANMGDEQYPGFDFKSGVASLSTTALLPQRADWHAGYVLNDDIAWSFFPMGIAAENGVLIDDPVTGKPVHVIGFDMHNEQTSLAKKRGVQIGPEITAAPQVLIAGGTGGGKALASDTLVAVQED